MESTRGETEVARGARAVHWTMRMNRRNRTWFSAMLFVTLATHLAAGDYSVWVWIATALQFFLYPQLVYYRAVRARDQRLAELHNLLLDGFFLGIGAGLLGFPVWLTFIFMVTVTVNMTVFRGRIGFLQAILSLMAGSALAVVVSGWHFRPETAWPTTILSILIIVLYVMVVAESGYARTVALQRARKQLREREQELKRQLEEIHILQEQLRDQADRDALTGLYNRRYFDSTLQRELARCEREETPLSVAMIDIDQFKRINDDYGHPAGDEVIRTLAAILAKQARAPDCACRYGGEEFMLLLPGVDMATAAQRAEKWREEFAATAVQFDEVEVRSTLSVGIAAFPTDGRQAADLIRAADLALYRAKTAGRNCVVAGTEASTA